MSDETPESNFSGLASEEGHFLMTMIGFFVGAWSMFESTVDAAIMKQLKITAKQAAIVVSGLGFERKISILRALLHEQTNVHKDASARIEKIMQAAHRNVLLHASITVKNGSIEFYKMDTKHKLTVRKITHKHTEFGEVIKTIADDIKELIKILGINDDEINAIQNIAKSLTTSEEISPSPPSASAE